MLGQNLSQSQIYGLVGLGTVFWGAAALTARYAGHILFANDLRRLATYAGSIPGSYMLILISEGLLGLRLNQRMAATVIMTATALPLDGVAMMWFPTLYENPELKTKNPHSAVALSRMGAAWILWGAGVGLILALFSQQ